MINSVDISSRRVKDRTYMSPHDHPIFSERDLVVNGVGSSPTDLKRCRGNTVGEGRLDSIQPKRVWAGTRRSHDPSRPLPSLRFKFLGHLLAALGDIRWSMEQQGVKVVYRDSDLSRGPRRYGRRIRRTQPSDLPPKLETHLSSLHPAQKSTPRWAPRIPVKYYR